MWIVARDFDFLSFNTLLSIRICYYPVAGRDEFFPGVKLLPTVLVEPHSLSVFALTRTTG
jgi:hypothetical protein